MIMGVIYNIYSSHNTMKMKNALCVLGKER